MEESIHSKIESIRKNVLSVKREQEGKCLTYPDVLKKRILTVLKESGIPKTAYAKRIGISGPTIIEWIKESNNKTNVERENAGFTKLQVTKPSQISTIEHSYTINGPGGIVLKDLDVGQVVELFTKLSEASR